MAETALVSVIVPTLNRAAPLARVLASIRTQTHHHLECIVVDDGSEEATTRAYEGIWAALDQRFVLSRLAPGERKSGNPGRARNRGLAMARGTFVAFCDDDDVWIRDDHLSVAVAALQAADADLFFADIRMSDGGAVANAGWNTGVDAGLRVRPHPLGQDLFLPTRLQMQRFLLHRHFHADTMVLSRALLDDAGPYWDPASVGEDVEISLRLADRARRVVYRATAVADLDTTPHPSAIRRYGSLDRTMYYLMVCLHAESAMTDPAMRRVARKLRAWGMLDAADHLASESRRRASLEFAAQAFVLNPSSRALKAIGRAFFERGAR